MPVSTTRLVKRIHSSWLLTVSFSSLLLGVVAARFLPSQHWVSYAVLFSGIALLITASVVRPRFVALTVACLSGLLIGLWRGAVYKQSLAAYDYYYDHTVTLSGRLVTDAETSTPSGTRLRLGDVSVQGEHAGGVVWVSTSDISEFKRSDLVTVQGELVKGFGTVPATMYRAKVLSHSRQAFSDVGGSLRDRFAAAVKLGIKNPESALANGFLVGAQSSLPEKLDANLKLLGLTHIVVASGYNLTILVRFSRRLFSKISRFASLVAALLLVYLFTLIAGTSPSMSRAAIVVVMSLLAWFYGRKVHPVVLLFSSAGVSVLIQPAYAWGDVGWLLSFGSFVGVLLLGPLLHTYFWHKQPASFVRQLLIETLAAYLVTLPLVIFIFGRFSPISVLANMAVLPLISPVMALTFVAGSVSLLVPSISKIVGFPAQFLLQYVTMVVNWLAGYSSASKEMSMSLIGLIVSYGVLLIFMLFLWRRSGHEFRDFNVVE